MKFAMFDTKPYDIPGFDKYGKEAGYEFTYFENHLTMDTVKLAQGFDGVVIFVNDIVDQAIVDTLFSYGIKIILLRCAGFNNVDSKAAYGKIHIYRVPAYSPESVAEHAMAMLLTSIRRIHKAYIRTRDFNFSLNGLVGFDLYGKTVGVVGTGRIGKCFIDICRGFKMNIIAYDKFPDPNYDVKYVSLEELFKESDIISLHCPLTDENTHMINKDSIDQMKKGVAIVNTSRGALINTEDLIEGIKEKKVGAACLDVYEEENNIFYHDFSNHIVNDDTLTRLISLPNVIVTAHQGFLTVEALDAIAKATVDNIKTFYAGEVSQNEICYHCPHVEDCKKKRKERCF